MKNRFLMCIVLFVLCLAHALGAKDADHKHKHLSYAQSFGHVVADFSTGFALGLGHGIANKVIEDRFGYEDRIQWSPGQMSVWFALFGASKVIRENIPHYSKSRLPLQWGHGIGQLMVDAIELKSNSNTKIVWSLNVNVLLVSLWSVVGWH